VRINMKKKGALALVIILSIFISCRLEVPVKEMIAARIAIRKAYQVKADKYDPDTLNQAVQSLNNSHSMLEKDDDAKSKEEAEKALSLANAAIEKTMPLLAGDALTEAKKIFEEADNLNAKNFAPTEYQNADGAIKEAESLNTEKKYLESYEKSKTAIDSGNAAKNIAQSKIPTMKDEIKKLDAERADLAAKQIPESAKSDLNLAKTNIDAAYKNLDAKNIKAAGAAMEEASTNLKNAKIKYYKTGLKDRIASLRKEADTLKKQRGSEAANDDIDVVVSTLNEADTLLEQGKTEEAGKKVGDAETSLKIARQNSMKAIASRKIASVEKQLDKARKGEIAEKYKDKIDSAAALLGESKKLFDKDSYDESLKKSGDAESVLNSIGIAGEKDDLKKLEGDSDRGPKAVYVVQYHKKNKDCLWKIAHKVYKNARLWPVIYMANKDQIKDPDLIFPGQKFVIPQLKEKTPPEKKEGSERTSPKEKK